MNHMNEGCLIEDPVSGETYAVLRFKRKELLYDIENVAYVEGHVMPDEAEHARHTVIDIGAEGNVDILHRRGGSAFHTDADGVAVRVAARGGARA